jgi:predicted ATPase with chaperone activity
LKSAQPFVHSILMTGVPGSGKALLARTPNILPEMSIEESLDVTGNSELPSLNGTAPAPCTVLGRIHPTRVGLGE